ncbi:hypothetical protein QJQ45_017394 [Haematococcus lacustris]|nr:hypothetical protein QJQ45_017394 [Haematococcus lacustris]
MAGVTSYTATNRDLQAEVQRLRDVEQLLMGTADGLQGDLDDLQATHQGLQGEHMALQQVASGAAATNHSLRAARRRLQGQVHIYRHKRRPHHSPLTFKQRQQLLVLEQHPVSMEVLRRCAETMLRVWAHARDAVSQLLERQKGQSPPWAVTLSQLLQDHSLLLRLSVVAVVGDSFLVPELMWASKDDGLHAFELYRHTQDVLARLGTWDTLPLLAVVAPRKPPQPPRSSQAASQPAASEPGPSTPSPAKRSKRTKAEPEAAEPTQPTKGKGKGKASKPKPAPQPGRWLDRDCNAALNMQRIGESKWRPLELCYWPEQGKLPAKGKEYPGLGYKRLRDKPAKTQQQQPAVAQ